MKKILALALAFVFALVGCTAPPAPTPDPPPNEESLSYESAVSWVNYSMDASLFMMALNGEKMAISSVQHLPIFKCESVEELDAFQADFSESLSLSATYDDVPSFEETCKDYTADFFTKHTLLLVYVPATSGTYRFGVDRIDTDGEGIAVHIRQLNDPETFTNDMAGWLVSVALQKEVTQGCTTFDADLSRP